MEEYETLVGSAFGEYEEKRSKFIAEIAHIESEDQASQVLSRIRSKYFDARHNCYAYILKDGTSRFSDDGEPHGTAGKPILDVLSGSGMVDAVIVVTRYFGGVLLGTGGLVRAYSCAASDATKRADRAVMCRCVSCVTECGYADLEYLKKLLSDGGGVITDTDFSDKVTVRFDMKYTDVEKFEKTLTEAFSARITLVRTDEKFSAFKKV